MQNQYSLHRSSRLLRWRGAASKRIIIRDSYPDSYGSSTSRANCDNTYSVAFREIVWEDDQLVRLTEITFSLVEHCPSPVDWSGTRYIHCPCIKVQHTYDMCTKPRTIHTYHMERHPSIHLNLYIVYKQYIHLHIIYLYTIHICIHLHIYKYTYMYVNEQANCLCGPLT